MTQDLRLMAVVRSRRPRTSRGTMMARGGASTCVRDTARGQVVRKDVCGRITEKSRSTMISAHLLHEGGGSQLVDGVGGEAGVGNAVDQVGDELLDIAVAVDLEAVHGGRLGGLLHL
eukprot:1158922-Pelagomonas_calceolata.AAC.5